MTNPIKPEAHEETLGKVRELMEMKEIQEEDWEYICLRKKGLVGCVGYGNQIQVHQKNSMTIFCLEDCYPEDEISPSQLRAEYIVSIHNSFPEIANDYLALHSEVQKLRGENEKYRELLKRAENINAEAECEQFLEDCTKALLTLHYEH